MNRLVINPGTPQAREIQLKPGANSLGRSESNDFTINDPSVSGTHCQVLVDDNAVLLKDAGSTNGTFVCGARIQQQHLEHGKDVRLGNVQMIFYSGAEAGIPAAEPVPQKPVVRVAIRVATPAVPMAMSVEAAVEEAGESTTTDTVPATVTGTRFCKFHPKSPARFLCPLCDRTYCYLCVNSANTNGTMVQTCRKCGMGVAPFQFALAPSKGFYAKLPGAFLYPFKGSGPLILIFTTIGLGAMNMLTRGFPGLIFALVFYGFLFLFMQNIIMGTTSDETELLSFPEMNEVFGSAGRLIGTVLASFWLPLGLVIAKYNGVEVPTVAIVATVILGGIYFPMAFLAVAMKDSVLAANPLIVVPAMLKVPWKYSITVLLLLAVFGIRQLGDIISNAAGLAMFRTHDRNVFVGSILFQIVWALLSLYFLIVTVRILGLFYNASKQKLGWFSY